ncbi:hypothetical protein EDD16DRAFT_1519065 [Pisolithus croceorrhizus]|nr:hypothetical protein EDD16DRAFT_1519065 [Pisolithus croceorrhizus]
MRKGERLDAKMSEIRDPDLPTLLRHKTLNNSGTTNAIGKGSSSRVWTAICERAGSTTKLQPSKAALYQLSTACAKAEVCGCGCVTFSKILEAKNMSTGQTGVGSSLEISGKHEYASCGAGGGHESERRSGVDSNMSTNVLHERVNDSSWTHYALDWGPGVAPGLSDDSALPLRVAHTTVVPRGYGGALTSGAEMNLVEPLAIQTVLESAPRHFPTAKYSLHEPQFTQIWPFQPQKKQNEYVRWESLEGLLRSTEGGLKLQKVQNMGSSGCA